MFFFILVRTEFLRTDIPCNISVRSKGIAFSEECEERFGRFFMHQAFGAVFGGLGVVPGMLIVLRAVPPEHRSVSLGFNGFLVSLLATLPSPIIWGKIIDMSCLLWKKSCDSSGSCSVYDTDELRVRFVNFPFQVT